MFFRLILVAGIGYLVYRVAKRLFLTSARLSDKFPDKMTPIKGEDLVEDPYCHTYVPMSDAYGASLNGKKIYFCSRECFEKYKAEKEKRASL